MLTKIGTFNRYTPDPDPFPGQSALYSKDENGNDWYQLNQTADGQLLWVCVQDGVVISFTKEPKTMFPQDNTTVYTTDQQDVTFGMVPNETAGTFDPPPPSVPDSVTNFQARALMLNTPHTPGPTLFDDVNTAVNMIGGEALMAWEYANDITRSGTLVSQIATQFGLTSAQLDTMFTEASKIEA